MRNVEIALRSSAIGLGMTLDLAGKQIARVYVEIAPIPLPGAAVDRGAGRARLLHAAPGVELT